MSRGRLSAAILALGLTACAQNAHASPHPQALPAEADARRLDEKPVGAAWTGADLLAAALAHNPQIAEARGRSSGAYGETVWRVRTDLEKARIDLNSARIEMVLATLAAAVRGERAERIAERLRAGQEARAVALAAQADIAAANRRVAAAGERRDAAAADLAKALGVSPEAARDLVLAPVADPPELTDLASRRRDAAAVDATATLAAAEEVLRRARDHDLPLAQRAHEAAASKLKVGEADKADELAAQAAVLDAQLALLDARHTAAIATADLEYALRRTFDPAETALIRAAMTAKP